MRTTGHPAGAESCCNIEATGMSINIQDLAGKVQSWNGFALQSLGIDLLEVNATLGDEGFGQRHLACDFNRQGLDFLNQTLFFLCCQLFNFFWKTLSKKVR